MKVIRDPVHGYIELDKLALSLIDAPSMQRLRRINQLGLSNLVYPGANHTRFEHSIGVMHLATILTSQIDSVTTNEKNELRAAALLHDIGHGPLSHVTEGIISRYTRRKHDDVKDIINRGEISQILDDARVFETMRANEGYAGELVQRLDIDSWNEVMRGKVD